MESDLYDVYIDSDLEYNGVGAAIDNKLIIQNSVNIQEDVVMIL
jgi:hypothetical protein